MQYTRRWIGEMLNLSSSFSTSGMSLLVLEFRVAFLLRSMIDDWVVW
jgi:hypothetical protein